MRGGKSKLGFFDKKVILDLCGGTGSWSKPYTENKDYKVKLITLLDEDVRLYEFAKVKVYGVLAAPPCQHFSLSGARWWQEKGPSKLLEGLSILDACMRIILLTKPKFWCLENPVGRISTYLGPPKFKFHPNHFGDPYTKKTYLWGKFNIPKYNYVEPVEGSKLHKIGPGPDRNMLRSITPEGFAKAFYEANR